MVLFSLVTGERTHLVSVTNAEVSDGRHYLKGSVLDGGLPVMAAYGMSSFDYQGTDPRFNKIFNEAMRGHTAVNVNQLLRTYAGFDDVKVLVDVGGGVGATLGMITSRHPHIKGINLDLPHVISGAQPLPGLLMLIPSTINTNLTEKKSYSLVDLRSRSCLVAGVQHVIGDMFEAVPSGDAIFLKVRTDSSDHYKNSNLVCQGKTTGSRRPFYRGKRS